MRFSTGAWERKSGIWEGRNQRTPQRQEKEVMVILMEVGRRRTISHVTFMHAPLNIGCNKPFAVWDYVPVREPRLAAVPCKVHTKWPNIA